jgi:uncharacterized protein (TIGR03067 family)
MRWQFPLSLVAVLIVGADEPKDETGKLQGTWAVVSADGIDAPEEAIKRLKVIIRRETIQIMVPEKDNENAFREKEKATFKLDPSKKPKAIDMTKDPKGPIVRGIYELDGDTLKLVWRNDGPRPTEILTKRRPKQFTGVRSDDDDLMIMVLKKEKQP